MIFDRSDSAFDMLQWMPPALQAAYRRSIRKRRHTAGRIIYVQGASGTEMYRIASGSVRLSVIGSDGKEVVFLRFRAGDCFGDSSLIDGDVRPHTAEAVTNVELEVLDLPSFCKLRTDYPDFDRALLQLLSRQMRFSSNLFMDLSLNELPGRIARRIVEFAQGLSVAPHQRTGIRLSPTQAEIAAMVNASRQSVNRVLQQLHRAGLVATEYNVIVVTDLDGLRKMASEGNPGLSPARQTDVRIPFNVRAHQEAPDV